MFVMKKNLFLLFTFLCTIIFITSCSDDDPAWKNIPSSFSNVTTTINGTSVSGKVSFVATSDEAAEVTLENVISGYEDKITIPVTMKMTENGSFNYEGQTSLDAPVKAEAQPEPWMLVKVSGTVALENGQYSKLTVNVTTSGWNEVSNIYQNDSLSVTVNGAPQTNTLPVTLIATSDSKVTIAFKKLVNIANDFVVEGNYTQNQTGEYMIEGSAEKEPGYLVNVKGTLSKDHVLTLEVTTSGYATISKIYYLSSNNLELKYNGDTIKNSDPNIQISALSASAATVKVNKLIPGEGGKASITIENVTIVKAGDSETYTLEGKDETEAYKIAFKGTISPDKKLIAEVTYELKSSLVGVWKVKTGTSGAESIFKFASKTGSVTLPDSIVSLMPDELKTQFSDSLSDVQLVGVIKGLLGGYLQYLNSIEFTSGGDVVITYTAMGTTTPQTLDNLLKYYIKGNQVYILIDIMSLMPSTFSTSYASSLTKADEGWNAGTAITDGIPLDFSISGSTLNISLNREITTKLGQFVGALLPLFSEMMPPALLPTITAVLNTVNTILADSEEFEAGLVMTK